MTESPDNSAAQLENPLRILLVDDERLLSELLAASLSAKSHTVVTAFNGEEGLRKFLEGDFDLVITDQSMPKMDGTPAGRGDQRGQTGSTGHIDQREALQTRAW